MTRRERLSSDPKKAAALQRARRRIAQELSDDSEFSVAKLRLNAGLSQAELANMMGTQQPAIARLEKGQTEPQLSTIEKLAEAFGVAPEKVLNAFIRTRSAVGKR
ncbi:MAG: helix-turn-helix transcriptional regulator [Alcaligenaceae bacterium]|nr:helix-turn-helix transcriptional regulator [Alcaligenaceae bacterium]